MTGRLFALVLAAFLVTPATSTPLVSSIDISYSTEAELSADVALAPCKNADRVVAVQELFTRCGATSETSKVVEAGKYKNFVVTIQGTGTGTIIIGAHYDKVTEGCGAVDNWSGVTLVAHLYKTFHQRQTKRTFIFVAFGGEEEGLKGSRAMADAIPKPERSNYCAMLNFDSFGLGRPQIIDEISSPKLTTFVAKIAEESKIPFYATRLGIGDSDSTSFKRTGIPSVTLHGLSSEWNKILHTDKDKTSAILPASLYAGYVLALNVMKKLDVFDCAALR
ncbi:MAG TPA: M20/M25/M40 family metallo-hydrolase [Blastocatellia bacterium]|nr:M20/M25/M40 family metallo-hydrolase [Blastocatellia bacterium]